MPVVVSTDEYWDVNGTALNTYAYNISTLTGRTGTTGLRGEDQEQAYRPGRGFRAKVPDSRTLPLTMWVQGSDPTSAGSGSPDHSAQFRSNLQMLEELFYSPREQFTLTKRWRDLTGLHTAAAKGQVISPILPTHSKNRATLVVDVFLADPFFYDTTPVVVPVALGTPSTATNPGIDTTPNHLTVVFTGPLTDPVLKNTTPNPDISLSYIGTIAGGASVTVDVANSLATLGSTRVNNNLRYSGSILPMEVFPGVNSFTLTASSGTGTATVTYRPAYL